MKRLEIILRTCDVQNVHTDWRVRYCDMPKKELIIGCVKSLIKSCNGIDGIKITVLDDHSSGELKENLKLMLNESKILYEFIELQEKGYNYSGYQQFLRCKDSDYTLVYSVEDDYLHCDTAIQEMLDSYKIFVERIKNPQIILYPFDNPEEYNPPNRQDFIVHGSNRHWRTGIYTTQVMMTTPQLFKNHWELFETLSLKYNGDYLNPRVEHYEESNTIWKIWTERGAIRFNPIPSLALHLQFNEQKEPFIDWKLWWSKYAQ
jgi:hypothetical protein